MSKQYYCFLSTLFSIITLLLLLSSSAIAAQPKLCTSEAYRQFDFWLGDWQVKDAKGNAVGENKIYAILGGCAISENWLSARGNKGKSYNFYDRAEKKWHQTWIDQSGNPLYLDGKYAAGKMILSGVRPNKEGKSILHRITWTPLKDGRVKQHWQSSADNGKTWADAFVGFYSKKQVANDELSD
ncbi:hypothetical protein FLL45_09105 [Aliikangiella marina]|uniref:DUF1579 domain-containing protein n=1 Tax=Aliikangiella marina TaxID=1712262 RepID=A0A545TD04_9GAMM|nr:hypothetical protein [Aliikangiella marina]TQV75089.1 hypothetical protein FLL45_09105 [Aliikangiella marina]